MQNYIKSFKHTSIFKYFHENYKVSSKWYYPPQLMSSEENLTRIVPVTTPINI